MRTSVASDANGNFVVVWQAVDADDGGIFGQRYDSDGNQLGGEFRVNTYTRRSQRSPGIASDANGNFVVIWTSRDQDGDKGGVFAQRYDQDGSPVGSEFQVNTYTTGSQGGSSAAFDQEGNFVIAWGSEDFEGDPLFGGAFARRYDSNGNPLGDEFQVNTYTTGHQDGGSVASDAMGNFIIIWEDGSLLEDGQDGSGYGVFGQRYDSGGNRLGGEFQVNTYTTGHQLNSTVASGSNGGFVVVWTSNNGGFVDVFGQRYDKDGSAVGGEFQVNTYTSSNHRSPALAADQGGNFVVVWDSPHDGSGYGVFGQRFSTGCRSTASNPTVLCWETPR